MKEDITEDFSLIMSIVNERVSSMDDDKAAVAASCHSFMTLPLELRLLIWERFGAEPRVFEYREDTFVIKPSREYRHPRYVSLSICTESRTAVQALLRPFEHSHDVHKDALPSPLHYSQQNDVFYLPPLVFRCRIQAWDSIWTTKPGIRNVGVHWSMLRDDRRILEALDVCSKCFTDMKKLMVFIEFKPLPQPEEEVWNGGSIRLLGPVEDSYSLPSLFAETHGFMDDFWTWGELRMAIETVKKGSKGMPEVEAVLYSREVEEVSLW
ncbi:hypothetical protein EsH8_VI_000291 [Colletotrichum jinshuiense]